MKNIKVAIIGTPFFGGIGNINALIQPLETNICKDVIRISRQQKRKQNRDKEKLWKQEFVLNAK